MKTNGCESRCNADIFGAFIVLGMDLSTIAREVLQ